MVDRLSPHRKLGLGTVQFGMAYGVANQSGRVSDSELQKIMALARRGEIEVFDTAPAYEQSETVLGQYLAGYGNIRVVTKTPRFPPTKATEADAALLRTTFAQSLDRLRVDSIHGLLLHRGTDLLRPNAELLWAEMENLKAQKVVQRLGVSVYTPDELSRVLEQFPIDIVQLPMNIVDQRFQQSGLLKQLDGAGIEVHVRSVFLQGVLVTEPQKLPGYFVPLQPHLMSLRQEAVKLGVSMLEMALNFVLHVNEVDTALVGIDSEAQLLEILQAIHTQNSIGVNMDWDRWALQESRWVNPSEWKLG